VPSADDHARLTSSLAHADGCLNIASTLSLDAAILDRPVICLDFTTEPQSPRDMLYAEYGAEHYAPLVASGGIRLAHSWEELLDLMTAAIDAPARDRHLRERMVEDECGPVDGHAAERVARTLITLADAAHYARHGLTAVTTTPS
jgi:CDP-glycerol glycerophosphotransferase (TagB/SpsB family)